jgi:predicted dehydrogenase
MDLMIHDLDLILSMDRSPVKSVSASGVALLGSHEDIAEARIEFESGCIANVKASRVATGATREMQVYATNGYANINFSSSEVQITRPSAEIFARTIALDEMPAADRMAAKETIATELLKTETVEAPPRNAILDEQNDFAISVRTGCSPAVSGEDGARAVDVANRILQAVAQHKWDGADSRPWRIGALATNEPRILPMPNRGTGEKTVPVRKAG